MSQSLRQNNLFAGQSWTVLYQAMNQINFSAYDYDSVRQALIDYVRLNYPEDFNDWIESSEFVAIIDMLSYLASSLSFRIDLNIRENFIDTATRRESILRLARMISYQPSRCIASQGLVKITQVTTDQQIFDSNGFNLANVTINWNDANNPDWFEQFILVLNAAFINGNAFGQPVKQGTVNGQTISRYDFDNTNANILAYPYNSTVNSQNMDFEICNIDFIAANNGSLSVGSAGYFLEKTPNILNPFSCIYQNDGNGNASAQTGFFMLFKQGSLGYTDFILDTPIVNRVIDLAPLNINNSDVWIETVDDYGLPIIIWTKVPAIFGSNIVYNNLGRLTQNVYQIITTDNNGTDAVSIKFGDGNFGNIPTGRIRVYYRTSNNQTYSVYPQDMQNVGITLPYASGSSSVNNLLLNLDLQYTVATALSREPNFSIQSNAPAVYYTQNRMANGEDYNLFPLQNTQALKISAVNRTYSGQNRLLDVNDPTGLYQDTKIYSNDGIISFEPYNNYQEIYLSLGLNSQQIVDNYLQPVLNGNNPIENTNIALRDFYLQYYPRMSLSNVSWANTVSPGSSTNNGVFKQLTTTLILPNTTLMLRLNSYVKFSDGTWALIVDEGNTVQTNYQPLLSTAISDGLNALQVIPSFRTTLLPGEITNIKAAIATNKSFGLTYDQANAAWTIINSQNIALDADFSLSRQFDTSNQNLDSSWLVQMKFVNGSGWQMTTRGLQFLFESEQDVRFHYVNTGKIVDMNTGLMVEDNVNIMGINADLSTGLPINVNMLWGIQGQTTYIDGYTEPRRVRVSYWDTNNYRAITNPDQFNQLVQPTLKPIVDGNGVITPSSFPWVFWQQIRSTYYDYFVPFAPKRIYTNITTMTNKHPVSSSIWVDGDVVYVRDEQIFIQYNANPVKFTDVTTAYKAAIGRNKLNFVWQHYADSTQRIDPAIMNIIDIYVLTSSYDTAIRNWIANNTTTTEPTPPTPEDLRTSFGNLESYKMMTDQIVWHPVKYKLLFGKAADPELQVTFKVVKNTIANITDSELKSSIINNINNYFSINNWNFGDSFYFTELAAYIHQQNPTTISSVIILPLNSNSAFGDLFEIQSAPDEIFISCAKVTDIQIVSSLTPSQLRIPV